MLFSKKSLMLLGLALLPGLGKAAAADWPHWLGPQRNGSSPETGLLTTWPASATGTGDHSNPVTSGHSSNRNPGIDGDTHA